MRTLALLSFGLIFAACGRPHDSSLSTINPGDPVIIEFRIAADTGKKPWNTLETAVQMQVGQVLRIFNDDKISHQLHTNGVPFDHGNAIKSGASADYLTKKAFNPTKPNEELYDHSAGSSAPFYLRVAAVIPTE